MCTVVKKIFEVKNSFIQLTGWTKNVSRSEIVSSRGKFIQVRFLVTHGLIK